MWQHGKESAWKSNVKAAVSNEEGMPKLGSGACSRATLLRASAGVTKTSAIKS